MKLQINNMKFNYLCYYNRNTASAEIAESLEVAIQCISDSFAVSLTNDEHKTQYSIQPLNLPGVFGLGLARKEQIESALAVCTHIHPYNHSNYCIFL